MLLSSDWRSSSFSKEIHVDLLQSEETDIFHLKMEESRPWPMADEIKAVVHRRRLPTLGAKPFTGSGDNPSNSAEKAMSGLEIHSVIYIIPQTVIQHEFSTLVVK
ncbi:hypothetical protein QYF36_017060 [Acer negundo]|nr:hypothetical protein QYF36_017060 [Acer negundo]